jgi:hypothetical protein
MKACAYALCFVHCVMCFVLCSVFCVLCSVFCVLCSVFCVLCWPFSLESSVCVGNVDRRHEIEIQCTMLDTLSNYGR